MNIKEQLLQSGYRYVTKRCASYKNDIESIKTTIKNNDKQDNSVNGKLINDLELNTQHLNHTSKMIDVVNFIDSKSKNNQVALGSLVKTTSSHFFIAIDMGKIEVENTYYISISSISLPYWTIT